MASRKNRFGAGNGENISQAIRQHTDNLYREAQVHNTAAANDAAYGVRGSTGRHRLQTGNGVRHLPTAADAAYKGKVVALDEMPADVASAFRGEKIDLIGAKQLQPEKSTVSKVLSDPMYYAEKVMSKPLDVVQSGVKDLLGGTKKQQERLAANKQMEAPDTPSIGKAVEGVLVKGADFAVSGVTSTLDWLLGNAMKEIGWENNPISKLNEFTQKNKGANAEYYAKNLEKGTDAQKKIDEYGTMTAAAIPQAVIAMMSAGASAGAQGAGMLAKGGAQLAGAEATASTAAAGQTVKNVATAMAKNPNYWTAFASVAGDSYQEAKEDGASDWEANMYALANGLGNAAIEVGGGIQTLPVELQAGKRGVRAWISSMADEGKEEPVQGVIERALQNLIYGKGNSLLSTKDENAVLNPVTAAKEFAGGAVVGGVLGGGQMLADAAINRRALPGDPTRQLTAAPKTGAETDGLTGTAENGIVEPTNGNAERARELLAAGASPSQVFNETGLVVLADGSVQDGFGGPVVWRANDGTSGISDSTADRRAERRADRAGAPAQDGRGDSGAGGLDYSGGRAAGQRTGWADLNGEQRRTATEVIIRAADASRNGETAMLRTALGGDDAFAERFYKLYQQGDAVAEQWGNFFPDVNALIAELDSTLAGSDRGFPQGTGAASRGFAGESFGNDMAPTQTHSTDTIYTEAERAIPGLRPEDSQHIVHHDTDVDYQAQERFESDYDGEKQDLFFHKQNWDDVDQNLALRIIANEVTKARETGDYSEVVRLQRENEAHGTEQGQAMRQRARFANTASGMVAQAAVDLSDAQRTRNITEQEKSGILQDVARYAEEWENIPQGDTARVIELIKQLNVTRKTAGFFNTKKSSKTLSAALEKVAQQDGGFDFLWEVAGAQIRGVAGDYAALSPLEAAKAIRYQNMLSKLSTYMRNFIGNNVFDPIESISNNIGVLADMLISKRTGRRTTAIDKSWFSDVKRKGSTEAALRSYIEVALDADTRTSENKYEQRTGRTFKMTGNIVERFFSTMGKWQSYALTTTDEFQKGGIRAETQRGIDALTESGKIERGALDGWADETARQRTFQNDGAIAKTMSGLRDAANNIALHDSKGGSLGVGDVAVPFAKVPGNVAEQFANYSPAGIARGAVETVNVLRKAKNGTVTAQEQAQAARSIGRALNGTAILALFGVAAAKGILNVAGSDDKDKEALEKTEGITGTQLNLSALGRMFTGESTEWRDGDDLMNIGFLEPINGLMAMGALLADAYEADGTLTAGDIITSNGTALLQTFLDLPAMSQIQELVNGYRYSKEETGGGKALDALGQYLGSQASSFVVPNAVSGIAQGIDQGVTRNTRTSDKTGFSAVPENAWSNFKSKIPFARGMLPATLDNWGNEKKTTASPFQNWLNSNVLPGSINQYKTNAVNQELSRLYDKVEVAYPDRKAPNSANFDGEKQDLTGDQRETYQKTYGQTAYSNVKSLINSAQYGKMSDGERAAAINYLYQYAATQAKKKVGADGGETASWTSKSEGSIAENAAYRAFLDTARAKAVPMSPSTSTETNGAQMQGTLKLNLSDAYKLNVFAQFLGDGAQEHVHEAYSKGYSLQQITDFYQAMNLKDESGKAVYKKDDLIRWATQNGFTYGQAQTMYRIFHPSKKNG